ncbi:hypothetical protein B4U79_07077 [Dinothrombium tinctorium]|uniref:DNA primase large subunit n=1 Tax=Dinothrombium tinctorium TaxID=1965070 RepID=A0A3S3PST3_9ACAR|nr:hypothetical protein B4U79_05738 [Dinothrombium tinctorium]RWS15781.1 hypothetical protein B4U79_07077 [Dinothrombium tinctorium]
MFITLESELLKIRLREQQQFMDKFFEANNLNFETAEASVSQELKKIYFSKENENEKGDIYKIPFEEALDVVKTRRAVLKEGYAYILAADMILIVVQKFQLELSQMLASLNLHLSEFEEDRRLIPLIDNLFQMSIKKKRSNVSSTKYHVTPEMLDDLSKESFPPCMKNIHENLRKNHHLRHYGRLHYGLFLKSIGLSLEDALNFFRQEFIQKVTPERFQKDYAYNIRYNYGKEGKKVSLSAYSCNKIINENAPQPGDTHGCPFRHFDAEHLKKFLKSCNISEQYIEEMLEDVKQKSYTKACSKYYQAKHNHPFPAEELYHPNQYYSESRKFFTVGLQLSDVSCGSEVSMQTEQNDTATEFYNNLECDEDVMHIDVSQVSELTKADSCGTSNEKDENEM